jgi:hypothetical protein
MSPDVAPVMTIRLGLANTKLALHTRPLIADISHSPGADEAG